MHDDNKLREARVKFLDIETFPGTRLWCGICNSIHLPKLSLLDQEE